MIHDLIGQSCGKNQICMSPDMESALHGLRKWMFENVYESGAAKTEEAKAQHMVAMLYDYYRKHIRELPKEYIQMMRERDETEERTVCDYIAGMTDGYAIDRFEALFIPQSWKI